MSNNAIKAANIATTWLGTPYHHQAAVKGVGCDCLGLLRGVFSSVYGDDIIKAPAYPPEWGVVDDKELLLSAAKTHLIERTDGLIGRGDVLVFRVKHAASARHCGIALDAHNMIHSIARHGTIAARIGPWRSRVAGVFTFP